MNAEPEGPALDAARIIEVLGRHEVDYLLIGGLASRYYGAVRGTEEVGGLARKDRDNFDRLAAALRGLGAHLRVGGLDDETARALPVVIDAAMLQRVETSTWRTDAGDIDVLTVMRDSGGARLGFSDVEGRATEIAVVGIPVRLAGLHDMRSTRPQPAWSGSSTR